MKYLHGTLRIRININIIKFVQGLSIRKKNSLRISKESEVIKITGKIQKIRKNVLSTLNASLDNIFY